MERSWGSEKLGHLQAHTARPGCPRHPQTCFSHFVVSHHSLSIAQPRCSPGAGPILPVVSVQLTSPSAGHPLLSAGLPWVQSRHWEDTSEARNSESCDIVTRSRQLNIQAFYYIKDGSWNSIFSIWPHIKPVCKSWMPSLQHASWYHHFQPCPTINNHVPSFQILFYSEISCLISLLFPPQPPHQSFPSGSESPPLPLLPYTNTVWFFKQEHVHDKKALKSSIHSLPSC